MTEQAVIHIVDDDRAAREGLGFLLSSLGLETRAHAGAADLLAAIEDQTEGCILADVRMPGMSGLELQRLLAARDFPLPIVIVTGHGDVQMAVEALKAGAFDFIEKPFKEQHLLDLVEAALRVSRARLTQDAQRREIAARLERLARREREVLEGILAGKANKVMAQDLDLSIKTIEGYRAAVMAKMQAGSVAELVRLIATLD